MQSIWFKRDLRITDHKPLAEAAKGEAVLCLYIAEPDYWKLPDTSARQWLAIAESLKDLDTELFKTYGARLNICTGDAIETFKKIHAQNPITHIYSHEETGNLWTYKRDINIAKFCRASGIIWREYQQFGVVRGLKNRNNWAASWEDFMSAPLVNSPKSLQTISIKPFSIPPLSELDLAPDTCPQRQKGGRALGLKCLNSFFDGRGNRYQFEMSSPLTAQNACSRLSLHIALGTLSLREIVQTTQAKRQELIAIPAQFRSISIRSIDAFISRLHWHCHFIQKLESEPSIENRSTHRFHERERHKLEHNNQHLEAWISGQTGFPFVDACMRSLMHTGWINFRMRAMLMSLASYHLGLDWTKSGARLARLFTDYEPGIHWPQVQMQSSQTGINIPRIYNPVKQSFNQDAEGIFIKKWLPEIAHLPLQFLHEPWLMSDAERIMHSATYPTRIIDHVIAAKSARDRLTQIRQMEGYRPTGQQVLIKHGSRKKQIERAKAQKPETAQLMFNL
jgi:deoxyribodipyrimidine photo-lyase